METFVLLNDELEKCNYPLLNGLKCNRIGTNRVYLGTKSQGLAAPACARVR